MKTTQQRTWAVTCALATAIVLAGCGGDGDATEPTPHASVPTAPAESATAAPSDDEPDDATGSLFPGDGEYAIGTDIPFGGFQLLGEPAEQPDGCTWQILDGDGTVLYEDQGVYVFLTDVPEYVTFTTAGCPEWEQFE